MDISKANADDAREVGHEQRGIEANGQIP